MSDNYGENFETYCEIVLNYPVLSDEELLDLFADFKCGDNEARNKIINYYLRDVIKVVLAYKSKISEENLMDVIHYGNMILSKRIKNFFEHKNNFHVYLLGEIRREVNEFIKLIEDDDKTINQVVTNDIDTEMLLVLKEVMSGSMYYCFYSVLVGVDSLDIADSLGISVSKVQNIYEKAFKIFAKYSDKGMLYQSVLDKLKKSEGHKKTKLKVQPTLPSNIINFMYLQNVLNEDEANLFYYKVFKEHEYDVNELCRILKFSRLKYIEVNKSLKNKIENYLHTDDYEKYRNDMLFKYGMSIYDLFNDVEVNKINYNDIKVICDNLTFDDIKTMLGEDVSLLNADEITLLTKFFDKSEDMYIDEESIERDVNLRMYGFNKSNHMLNPNSLYDDFLKNKEEFSEEQCLFLECYYFKIKDRSLFKSKYPDSSLYSGHDYLFGRMERIHYGTYKYLENDFSKEKYLIVKEKYANKLTPEKIAMLDLYYGVNGKRHTITEIAQIYGYEYLKTHDIISTARDSCISLYANRSNTLELDKSIYIPYLSYQYEYTEENREILKMYLVEEATYDEIAKRTGLTKYRISNIITEGIRKIDFYRFGLSEVYIISPEEMEEFFEAYKNSFNEVEREVVRDKFIRGIENSKIAESRKMELLEVNRLTSRFYRNYDIYKSNSVTCELADIIKEVNRHESESFLNKKEKMVVSLCHGIKNDYNIEGSKLTYKEISDKYGLSLNVVHHNYYLAIDKIKARKAGIRHPDLCYFERDELDKILDDNRLPISDKEREIICYIFALKGYPYKDLKEVSEMYGETKNSVRRRYYRSIVTIKKYLNGEIEEKINYEEDLVPILRYFSVGDRMLIEDHFKNNLTYENMAKKYNLIFDKVAKIMSRIKINIFDLLHEKDVKKFDFDHYLEAINDDRFPYYGDKELAKKIFDLFFGMNGPVRLGAPEIIKLLKLDFNTSAVNNCINTIMLDVCKFKDGIYKEVEFNYQEICDYYEKHKDSMVSTHRAYYERYIKKMKKQRKLNGKSSGVSEYITYDLIKEKYEDRFKLRTADRSKVLEMLRERSLPISSNTRLGLMYYFNIRNRDMMSGKEIGHVYKLIDNLVRQGILRLDEGITYKKDKKD